MKIPRVLISLVALATLALNQEAGWAQEATDQPVYQVTFYKTKPGRQEDYTKKVEELAIPVNKELMKQGVIEGYYRYQVLLPAGASVPYNIVSMSQYKNLAAWAASQGKFAAAAGQMFPNRNFAPEFADLRDQVRSILLRRVVEVGPPPAEGTRPVFAVVLVKVHPGHGQEFAKLVEELTIPVQKELQRQGITEAHWRGEVLLPTGAAEEVNMVAATRYKDLAAWAAAEGKSGEMNRKLFPGRNPGRELVPHREVVRVELVRLTHSVVKPTT